MSHTCRALVIRCMDFRLSPEIKSFLEREKLLGDCDIVSIAGAAKNFLDPESAVVAFKQIEISQRLHGITEVHLMNHTDCGAYGGRRSFASDEAEREKLIGDMQAAAAEIKKRWPELKIKFWLPHIEEAGHETRVRIEKITE
jgi:carbonic anhydrase